MKLASFRFNEKVFIGAVIGEQVVNLTAAGYPSSMREFLDAGPELWQKARTLVATGSVPLIERSELTFLAPVTNPSKVVAIGLNYKDHAKEQGVALPGVPLIFAKFPSALTGPYDDLTWDTGLTSQVDYEVELGVVIGKTARRVSEENALEYVFGYTVINDVSARDLQFSDKQWVRAKSLDTFCPAGPWIVTGDEIPDPHHLSVRCLVNGQVMQSSNTEQLIFDVRQLVAYLSQSFTLEPGDMIATGTPGGVGVFRNPPVFLQDGDVVVTEIESIGQLRNVVHLSDKDN